MTPERFKQVEELFGRALEVEASQRDPWLTTQCATDTELLHEVRSLLHESEGATQKLGDVVAGGALLAAGDAVQATRDFGPYRIISPIGGGGMGSVYAAVRIDGQFEKRVAIKLIRNVYAADALFVHRFLEERQILARMEHPHIARLLDGGITDDRVPYLVMEYVDGKAITLWCAELNATIPARLEIFRQVCSAVQYAHQNLIIHRDLKPANILVTPAGEAKLLDFGVAKTIESDPDATRTGPSLMTLDYASPEQVRGELINTASDIYSLGLLLYELLAGRQGQKTDATNPTEMFKKICDVDPPLPSVIAGRRELTGDLDNIVMKAIRKEPGQRYASVEQFSADLERYAAGLPVLARPSTLRYRTGKFVRRHRLSTALAAVAVFAVAVGGVLTIREARIASRRFDDVRGLAHSVVFEFDGALANLSGSTPARKLIVDRAIEYLNNLTRDASGNADLQRELASAYEKVAGIQGDPTLPNLGDAKGALESYRRAVGLRLEIKRKHSDDSESRSFLVSDYGNIGTILRELGDDKGAQESYQRALDEGRGLEATSPAIGRRVANIYLNVAELKANQDGTASALPLYAEGVRLMENTIWRFPREDLRKNLASAYSRYARALWEAPDLPKALETAQRAFDLRQKLEAESPNDLELKRSLYLSHVTLGDVLGNPAQFSLNRTAEALNHYDAALKIAETSAGDDPKSYRAQRDLLTILNRRGDVLYQLGKREDALACYQRGLNLVTALVSHDSRPSLQRDVAIALDRVGDALSNTGKHAEGVGYLKRAVALRESIAAKNPKDSLARRDLILSYNTVGQDLRNAGQLEESAKYFRQGLAASEALARDDPEDSTANRNIAVSCDALAQIQMSRRQWTEARALLQRAIAMMDTLKPKGALLQSDIQDRKHMDEHLKIVDDALRKQR